MHKPLLLGAIFGGLTVAIGAFGAHALEGRLDDESMGWLETAMRIQGLHALALIALAPLADRLPRTVPRATVAFSIGILLFSGSLVALALSEWVTGADRRWLGAVTPFGGVSLLVGWAMLAVGARNERGR